MKVAYWTILSLMLATSISVTAQQYRTVELKPITYQGWRYMYDLKRVSGANSIEVPLMALNDTEVNRQLRAYRTYHTIAMITTTLPLIYILSENQQHVRPETFWWLFGGSIATQIGLDAVAHFRLHRGIDRYNELILQPTGFLPGATLIYKF